MDVTKYPDPKTEIALLSAMFNNFPVKRPTFSHEWETLAIIIDFETLDGPDSPPFRFDGEVKPERPVEHSELDATPLS